jgi:SprB-like repeat protein/type IX secretion system substrate protein/HYR domain-containing protein
MPTGNYYLLVDNFTGSGVGFTIQFAGTAVIGPPVLPPAPAPITGPTVVCPGGEATFSVPAVPSYTYYSWGIVGGPNGPFYTTIKEQPLTFPTTPGTYQVCVAGYAGLPCIASDTTCITVEVAPIVTLVEDIICFPGTYTAPNGQSFFAPGTYEIVYESQSVPGCDSTVLLTLTAAPTNLEVRVEEICGGDCFNFEGETLCESGNYEKVYTNQFGCDSTILLILIAVPLESSIEGVDTLTCNKTSFVLDGSTSTGGADMTYTWLDAGGDTLSTTTTLTVTLPGDYTLVTNSVVGGDTCTDQSSVEIIADTAPPDSLSATGGTLNCVTDTVMLTGNSSSPGVTYAWSGPGGFTSASQNPEVTVSGNYVLTVTGLNGCTATATAEVAEDTEPPIATAMGGSITCLNATVVLAGNSPAPNSTYFWQGPGGVTYTVQNPEVSDPGKYILTVTAPNGCTGSVSTVVQLNTAPPVADAGENGTLDCNASSVVLNGTGSSTGSQISYEWTTADGHIAEGGNTLTPTVDATGTYTLTVTNSANGCTNTAQTTVVQSPEVTADISSQTDVSCFGGGDGSATATGSGGTGLFTFSWSNGASEATASSLGAGTYSVTATDEAGCTATATVVVAQPDALAVNASATPQSAPGVDDGTATANPTGGTPGYTFAWDNGETTAILTGLAPGNYGVSVTDANGCEATQAVTVSASDCIVKANVDFTNVSCNGGSDGSATISLENATEPFSFTWSSGDTTQTISDIPAGTYNVTATDANDCAVVSTINISQPAALNANATTTGLTAFNANDGTATANPTGGTGAYAYAWNTGGTTATITALAPGEYTVVVTDENGCEATQIVVISPFDCSVLANITSSDVACNGAAGGQATVTLTGGVAPFNYLWSNDETTATIANLAPGTYSVSVVDAVFCPVVAEVTISEPAALEASVVQVVPADCGSNNGMATVAGSGGTPGYSYAWPNGASGATATGLATGTHTVTVTDANGCEATAEVEIGLNDNELPVVVTQNLGVELDATGAATITPAGVDNGSTDDCGIAAMTLDISAFNCDNLGENEVTLTVTDETGNSSTGTAIVTVADNIPPVVLAQNITLELDENGNATLNAAMLDNGSTDNCGIAEMSVSVENFGCDNLGGNEVQLTVTDGSGNSATATVTVQVADNLPPQVACPGDMVLPYCDPVGNYDVTASDNCSGGLSIDMTSGLPSGSVFPAGETVNEIEVADESGNTATCSFTVSVPQAMSVGIESIDATCFGENDGSITTAVANGAPGYTYLWSNNETTPAILGLGPGEYTVSVTDEAGCEVVESVIVNEPPQLLTVLDSVMNETGSQQNGSVNVTVIGGVQPYEYVWTDTTGTVISNEEDVAGLSAGTYQLAVTDANGCVSLSAYTIQSTTATNEADLLSHIRLFPNPTSGLVTLELTDIHPKELSITAFDVNGRVVLRHPGDASGRYMLDFSRNPGGVYVLKIMLDDQILTRRLVVSR